LKEIRALRVSRPSNHHQKHPEGKNSKQKNLRKNCRSLRKKHLLQFLLKKSRKRKLQNQLRRSLLKEELNPKKEAI
jgi:hypothetical protein